MKNFYPKLPILDYEKTSVSMDEVIKYLQSLPIPVEIKRSVYVIFRNESANGKSGVNNNFIGFQSDSGVWQSKYNKYFVGTTILSENRTGKQRGFLCFSKWEDSIDILADKVKGRGLFIGGVTNFITKIKITDKGDLAVAYLKEWVTGSNKYVPTTTEITSFVSMYNQAIKLFS